ncbi:MAG: mechanosensitive ion channel domain-containing protein [Thiohalocapsa sp.]
MNLSPGVIKALLAGMLMYAPLAVAQTEVVSELNDPEPVIEVMAAVPDARIQERIQRIYAEIDTLKGVEVDVKEGVVALSGSVSNENSAIMARNLAIRTEGAVAVKDQLERSLDIEGNVSPLLEAGQQKTRAIVHALPLLLLALAVFFVIGFLGQLLASYMPLWRRVAPNVFLAQLLSQAVRIATIIAGLAVALNLVGDTAHIRTILGSAGVIGIAIGFAVRDSMENYISSIMLSIRQPFRPQDHVVINEHEGIVVRLTSRATILMTLSGNHLRIPNSTVFKAVIQNYTTNPERRFEFRLGVDAADDPVEAIQTGTSAIASLGFVLQTPKPGGVIIEVGDSSIIIQYTGWIDQTNTSFGSARSLAISTVTRELGAQGFTLPEPIYRLRFDSLHNDIATSLPEDQQGHGHASDTTPSKKTTKPAIDHTGSKRTGEEQALDVSPDSHLTDKIDAERAETASEDLLDNSRPVE